MVPAVTDFPIEVTNYTSTDTYEMSVYAKTLNGSTTSTTPVDLPYKIAVRYPNEDVKIYSGIATNLTVGTSATAVPRLQIVKTTIAGVSSFGVTYLP